MKKQCLLAAVLLSTAVAAQASVTVQLDSGVLRTSTGTPLTTGLLMLVAERTTSTAFAAPTATSFVGGDTANELVISQFSFNQGGTGFVLGESNNVANFTYESTTAQNSSTTFDPGDALLLRWYPTLALGATSPGAGATYGQYRSSATPDGGITFFGPTDGATLTLPNGLNFLTTSASGSNPDLAGYASNTVVGVPEPSSIILSSVVSLLGLAKLRKRRT